MADYIEGQDLVKQDAYDAVLKLDKMMGDLVAKFDLVAKSALTMKSAIGDTKGINDYIDAQKRQKNSLDEIEKIEKKLADTLTLKGQLIQEIKLKQQEEVLNNKAYIKSVQAQEGSINQLRLQLNQATKAYDAMSKAERESGKGTTLLTNIQNTTTALKQLEANTGRFQRNVGNYTNATFQLTQVMRELPNFAQSAEIGIRSLGNNLPMLAQSFGQVRKQAGGTIPALKIFASSLFTFSGIFPLVLMGLIAYSDEIINFITGTKKANEFTKQMGENIGKQTGEIERMSRALNSENISHETKLEIANKLLKIYPTTLNNYSAEEIAAGKAAGAIDTLKESLVNLAIAKAAQADLDKQADKRWQQEVKRQGLLIDLAKAQAEETRATAAAEKAMQNPPRSESQSMLYDVIIQKRVDAENAVISIQEEIQKLDYDTSQTNKTMNKLAVSISKITSGVKKKTGLDEDGNDTTSTTTGTTKAPKAAKERPSKQAKEYIEKDAEALFAMILQGKELTQEQMEILIDYGIKLDDKDLAEYEKTLDAKQKAYDDYWQKYWSILKENWKKLTDEEKQKEDEQKKKDAKRIEDERLLEEALFNLKIQAINAFADISSTITDRIMSDIEARSTKEIEAIDLKEQAELDAIDRLTLSESERDERKKIVELQAEARRKKIEEDKIKDLRKYALFQKGVDTLAIISTTALSVMNALSDRTPIPYYVKVANAVGAGITGAVQLAKVLATRLPQYEFGTPEGGHTGGKAIVGEAGTELGRTPDGKLFLTPSKASIMDLPKRTEIIPHDITKDLLGATMVRLAQANTAVSLDMYQDELIEAFERGTDKITKAIYKNRTNISIGGSYRDYVKSNQL
jgi:hypothetical protein